MTDETGKIDLIKGVEFIWKNRTVYIAAIAVCMLLSLVYCIWGIPRKYECEMVLYYPERGSGEVEAVSDRKLMDDAVAILQQRIILEPVGEKTGLDWKTVQSGLRVTGNPETGIMNIVFQADKAETAYEVTEAVLEESDSRLSDIVPVGDLVLLEEPEIPEKPVADSWMMEAAAGFLAGGAAGTLISVLKKTGYLHNKLFIRSGHK